ncbi:TRAP transporter, DctM subunit [Phaeobacter inhibens]|nr:TRAP transporter, DctM subunit [Phaeobacter inhibens]AUR10197.1 TRAP transporter, DctM subunit [Phaeobacter inhibens]
MGCLSFFATMILLISILILAPDVALWLLE